MDRLKKFIRSLINVSEDDLQIIVDRFQAMRIEKGQFLLRRGQIASHYYFINTGALRFFYSKDQEELTTWVVFPEEFFTEISSLNPQQPTRFNIEAIESSDVYYIAKADMEMLYHSVPLWQEFGRKIWEVMAMRMMDEIIRFQTLTAEERYLQFLQSPGFMQRVSVKQLASYLGITPNALSRIRKNIR